MLHLIAQRTTTCESIDGDRRSIRRFVSGSRRSGRFLHAAGVLVLVLMFVTMQAMGEDAGMAPDVRSVVISRTMRQADHPDLTIVNDAQLFVAELKTKPGKDIWLWDGGELFHSLLGAGLVDGVDVGVIPVLLGGGIPLLPTPAPGTTLALRSHHVYDKSGIVGLEYDIVHSR